MPGRWAARLARRHPPSPKRPQCIKALRRLCPFDSGDRQCRNPIRSAFCFTTATRPKCGFMPPSAPLAALSFGTGRGAPRRSNGRSGPAGGYARPARSRSPCNSAGTRVIVARGAGRGRDGRTIRWCSLRPPACAPGPARRGWREAAPPFQRGLG